MNQFRLGRKLPNKKSQHNSTEVVNIKLTTKPLESLSAGTLITYHILAAMLKSFTTVYCQQATTTSGLSKTDIACAKEHPQNKHSGLIQHPHRK